MSEKLTLTPAHIEAMRRQWDGDLYPCSAEFYALCDLALSASSAYAAGVKAGREEAAQACIVRAERCGHRASPRSVGDACAAAIRALLPPDSDSVRVPMRVVEFVSSPVPEAEIGDEWTKGYEECKRRIKAMLAAQERREG